MASPLVQTSRHFLSQKISRTRSNVPRSLSGPSEAIFLLPSRISSHGVTKRNGRAPDPTSTMRRRRLFCRKRCRSERNFWLIYRRMMHQKLRPLPIAPTRWYLFTSARHTIALNSNDKQMARGSSCSRSRQRSRRRGSIVTSQAAATRSQTDPNSRLMSSVTRVCSRCTQPGERKSIRSGPQLFYVKRS